MPDTKQRVRVPADRARAHLRHLTDTHLRTRVQIAAATGIARQTIQDIASGKQSSVEARTEARILAVSPDDMPATRVHATAVARHLDNLVCAGAYLTDVAALVGSTSEHLGRVQRNEVPAVRSQFADAVLGVSVDDLPRRAKPGARRPGPKPGQVRRAPQPDRRWGDVRRGAVLMWRRGATVPQIVAALGIPETRVLDALAGVSRSRGTARSWPPVATAPARTTTRGRAA